MAKKQVTPQEAMRMIDPAVPEAVAREFSQRVNEFLKASEGPVPAVTVEVTKPLVEVTRTRPESKTVG